MKLVPPPDNTPGTGLTRPASPYDVLDASLLMSEVLHVVDSRTLAKLIDEQGLPVHRGPRNMRWFIRGEVLDWMQSRCISTRADQDTEQAG